MEKRKETRSSGGGGAWGCESSKVGRHGVGATERKKKKENMIRKRHGLLRHHRQAPLMLSAKLLCKALEEFMVNGSVDGYSSISAVAMACV
jgi:hypothetical protein